MIIEYTPYEVHIAETLLRMLRFLAFTRSVSHPPIQNRGLHLTFHFALVIDLSMKERFLMFAIFYHGICIHTVKIVLRVSKLTGIIDEAATERTMQYKGRCTGRKHQAIKCYTQLHSLTHLFVFDLFYGFVFI